MPLPTSLDEGILDDGVLGDGVLEDASVSYLYPHAWPPGTDVSQRSFRTAVAAPPQRTRAIIGNELRLPTVWCELGTCIVRFSHPDALGIRDVRARAEAAGWRWDAFGRLACPECQQSDPAFRATHPVVPWSPLQARPAVGGRP